MSGETVFSALPLLSPWREAVCALDDDLAGDLSNLRTLAAHIPLAVWAKIMADPAAFLPRSSAFLPSMPTADEQVRSVGMSGDELTARSVDYVRTLLALAGPELAQGPVLDLGMGWGRISRLLLKYVPVSALSGVDCWDVSIEGALASGLSHPIRKIPMVPSAVDLSGGQRVIYAPRFFLRLGPSDFTSVLRAIFDALLPGGVAVVSVACPEFWLMPHLMNPDLVARTLSEGIVCEETPAGVHETTVTTPWMRDQLVAIGFTDLVIEWLDSEPNLVIWRARRPDARGEN